MVMDSSLWEVYRPEKPVESQCRGFLCPHPHPRPLALPRWNRHLVVMARALGTFSRLCHQNLSAQDQCRRVQEGWTLAMADAVSIGMLVSLLSGQITCSMYGKTLATLQLLGVRG